MKKVQIIAEMSANHCGDKKIAKKIIRAAKECGADAVKIQTYKPNSLTIDCKKEDFLIKDKDSLWRGEYLYKLYERASTPYEWQQELKSYADSIGISLFSTPFDREGVDFLESIDVPMYKIASFEAYDFSFIRYVASKLKPVIISTGISSLEEIEEAIRVCHEVGNKKVSILKCTSSYPATLDDMNILTVQDMVKRFSKMGVTVGLSDHSMSNETVVAAVALGAEIVEKHFTLDRNLGGADSGFSLNVEEFKEMVRSVRRTERLLGSVSYEINKKNRQGGRSLYVCKEIKEGEVLSEENIKSIRPGFGMHPKFLDNVIGRKAKRSLSFGTPLKWEDIE